MAGHLGRGAPSPDSAASYHARGRPAREEMFPMLHVTLAGLVLGAVCQAAGADGLAALEAAVAAAPPVTHGALVRQRPAELAAVDCQGLSTDEQITFMCLQGLVNRKSPRLFLVGLNDFNRPADLFWLERFRVEYGIASHGVAPWAALRQYAGELGGFVVYSPEQPWSENLAAMLGSLMGWLPVSLEVAARAEAAGLQRRASLAGLWPDRLAAHRWALAHLLPKLRGTDFGTISERSWLMIRDYLVMRGAFTTSLTCLPGPERDLKGQIMSALPPGSIQWGWTVGNEDEGSYTRHASAHGHRTLCSTNADNMSVFSQIAPRGTPLRQPPRRTITPERKVYLAFVLSDGDSIPIGITRQWYRWTEGARGKVPFGWEIQPLLCQLAPVLLEYYYQDATPLDEFILGPSGAGYTNPSLMPNLGAFLHDTEQGLRATDSRVVGIIDERRLEVEREFSHQLPSATGFFYGWGGSPTAQVAMVAGKPHCDYRLLLPEPTGKKDDAYYKSVGRTVREIARRDGLPCCIPVHLSCYWSGPDDVPKVVQAIGRHLPVEVVKPGELAALMRTVYADRISLTAPRSVQVVAGLQAMLPLTLSSTGSEDSAVTLSASASPGLAVVMPAQVRVPAQGSVTADVPLRLSPRPGGGSRLSLSATARCGLTTSRAHVRVTSVPPPGGIPSEATALQSTWEAEALEHNYGHEEADPAAHNRRAWVAQQGRDSGDGWAVWGPYEPLQPGDYAAAFRVKTSAPGPNDVVAKLDVFDYEGSRITGDGHLAQGQLAGSTDGYRDVWLKFSVKQPLRAEYRVSWGGVGEMWVDRIMVLRLGPAGRR